MYFAGGWHRFRGATRPQGEGKLPSGLTAKTFPRSISDCTVGGTRKGKVVEEALRLRDRDVFSVFKVAYHQPVAFMAALKKSFFRPFQE